MHRTSPKEPPDEILAKGVGAPLLLMAYLSAVCMLALSPDRGQELKVLAPAGQMALTNYLVHSVVCTNIFFGYGFGLFGKMGMAAGINLAFAVYLLQNPFNHRELKRYKDDPAEWLWRSLTSLKPQPMNREKV